MAKGTIPYLTPYSPSFSIHLCGKLFKAEHGILMLTEEAEKELQDLIASGRGDINSQVRKVDEEAAKKKAEEYLKNLPRAAHGGVLTSDNEAVNRARSAQLGQTRETLTQQSNPLNIQTQQASAGEPMKVQEVPSTPAPKTSQSLLSALRNKADKASS